MPVSDLSPHTYMLTVSAISGGFSAVIGPVAPKSHSQMVDTETSISAEFPIPVPVGILFPVGPLHPG